MTASALWCSSAAQTLPTVARPADYAYVLTAEVDQSKDAVGMSEPYWSYNHGDIEADLDAMVAMGITNVRIQVPWVYVEPQQGVYDWATVDAIVEAADARGLGIVAIVSHTPGWAGDGGFNSVPDPDVYADFAGEVAQRYQGSVNAYEVWNEPNGAMFYESADPEDYTAMLQAAYAAIKEADSSNIVIAGVLGSSGTVSGVSLNPVEFVEGMYSAGAKDYFDVLSFHPYAYPLGTEFSAGEGYPGSAYEQLQAIWDVMEEAGDSKQIWATEFGVPTSGDISEADQAAIIAEFLSAWSEFAYTGPMFIHSTRDLESGSDSLEDNFGIFYTNGDPKLAVEAIAQWIEEQQQVEEPDPEVPPTNPGYDLGAALQAFVASVVGQVTAFVQGVSNAVGRIITSIVDAVTRPFTRLSSATSEQTRSA
ncbi:MAG: cellulase family glycosylhydrolase, partial [Actinomycetota bacterium]|nr:cellulase family glycosylhydrolase [Actinomycetota bacterium]